MKGTSILKNVIKICCYKWVNALRAFITSRKNILFRYFIEYAIYKGFLKNVTKIDILINLKIITLVIKQSPIS